MTGMTEYRTHQASSRWHDAVPIGERMSAAPLLDDPMTAFEGDLRLAPIEPMLVPEKPRHGELDPTECGHCKPGDWPWLWRDEHWHVSGAPSAGIPFWGGLAPNEHVLLHEMSPELLATMGPVIQRLAKAIQDLDGVARAHFSRWGDGGAHFHVQFMSRPLGMMQARGYMLAVWDDVLPRTDPELLAENHRQVAAAMAAGGGEALV
jgi:diadenosine tetraphosphate (Ap4A) HIT family hydrolase